MYTIYTHGIMHIIIIFFIKTTRQIYITIMRSSGTHYSIECH